MRRRVHADIEVVTLGVGRADMRHVGIALNRHFDGSRALGRRIAMLTFEGRAVELHKHRVVNFTTEGGINGVQIALQAVRGDLDAIGEREARSPINSIAAFPSRRPTCQQGTSLVCASVATQSQASPASI